MSIEQRPEIRPSDLIIETGRFMRPRIVISPYSPDEPTRVRIKYNDLLSYNEKAYYEQMTCKIANQLWAEFNPNTTVRGMFSEPKSINDTYDWTVGLRDSDSILYRATIKNRKVTLQKIED